MHVLIIIIVNHRRPKSGIKYFMVGKNKIKLSSINYPKNCKTDNAKTYLSNNCVEVAKHTALPGEIQLEIPKLSAGLQECCL